MFANNHSRRVETNYNIRRLATDYAVPLITNVQVAEMLADALGKYGDHRAGGGNTLEPRRLEEYYAEEAQQAK